MSEFFRRYVEELIAEPEFRDRHPHFHVRLIPIDALDFVNVGELEDRALRQYNDALAAFESGGQVDRITIELSIESATPTLAAGDPILKAAREAGVSELMANVRYESKDVPSAWWDPSHLPTLDAITTDDDVALVTDDDIELME
jgi:hypothetical protein